MLNVKMPFVLKLSENVKKFNQFHGYINQIILPIIKFESQKSIELRVRINRLQEREELLIYWSVSC